jgi:hypothetical protein
MEAAGDEERVIAEPQDFREEHQEQQPAQQRWDAKVVDVGCPSGRVAGGIRMTWPKGNPVKQ